MPEEKSSDPTIASSSISELSEAVRIAALTRTPLIALGAPGIGKTQIITQTAATLDYQYTEAVIRDVGDAYMPFVTPAENGVAAHLTFHYSSRIPIVGNPSFDPSRPIIFNLDEFTTYNRLCQNLLLKVLDEWRIGEANLLPNTIIVATGNRAWDYAHTEQLSAALANRGTIIHFEADTQYWMTYALSHDFHPLVIAWVKFDTTNLHYFDPKSFMAGDYPHPTPRSNEKLSRLCHLRDSLALSDSLFRAEVCGTIGMSRGVKFAGFAKIQRDLPDLDAICQGKKVAMVDHAKPAVLYATIFALIQRANRDNLHHITAYLDNVRPEHYMFITKNLTLAKGNLVSTSAWAKWLTDHGKDMS